VTVDNNQREVPTGSPQDERILTLLEEHKALPTPQVAAEVEANTDTIRDRLQTMATMGLIERRETVNSDVWLIW